MNILKNYLFFILLTFTINADANAQAGNHYLIKAAQVNYIFSGDFTGSENLFFDNYGSKELLIKKLHTAKGGKIVESKAIRLNDTLTEMDINTHQKQIIPLQSDEKTNQTLVMLNAGNFNKLGEETIAGCTCQKYTGEMGIVCIWKGVILKSEISVADKKMIKTAVLVDTVTAIKSSLFSINEH